MAYENGTWGGMAMPAISNGDVMFDDTKFALLLSVVYT